VPSPPHSTTRVQREKSSNCLLFAPAEYFTDDLKKMQLIRTLSSSYRVHSNPVNSNESNEDLLSTSQNQQMLSGAAKQSLVLENNQPWVYVLCVPISSEVASEWRGVTHTITDQKNFTSTSPLNHSWKTTSLFLLTQQSNMLENFDDSFKDRLSKINVQQSDLYNFETRTGQILRKRSCFENVDRAMNEMAHTILSLCNRITDTVARFETMVDENNRDAYVVSEAMKELSVERMDFF
jgi:hypothetical protein